MAATDRRVVAALVDPAHWASRRRPRNPEEAREALLVKPVLASSGPSALRLLAERLPADRALVRAFCGTSCRAAVLVGAGLDGFP
jgi:hypothetical protein